jgi:hypothetical protein
MDADKLIEDVVLGVTRGLGRRKRRSALTIVTDALAEIVIIEGVDQDFVHVAIGIEVDPHGVASELGVDFEEEIVELDVGEVGVDLALELLHEVGPDGCQIDLSEGLATLVVPILWSLSCLGVDAWVVGDVQPGAEGTVEFHKRQGRSRPDFRLELLLDGLDEAFHESAWGRVAHRPVKKLDVKGVTCGSQLVGDEDFGVVEVDL